MMREDKNQYLTLALECCIMVSGLLWPEEHPQITKEMLEHTALVFRKMAYDGRNFVFYHGPRGMPFAHISYEQLCAIDLIRNRMHLPIKWLANEIDKAIKGNDQSIEKVVDFFGALQSYANYKCQHY